MILNSRFNNTTNNHSKTLQTTTTMVITTTVVGPTVVIALFPTLRGSLVNALYSVVAVVMALICGTWALHSNWRLEALLWFGLPIITGAVANYTVVIPTS